jgi:hypothetical protein
VRVLCASLSCARVWSTLRANSINMKWLGSVNRTHFDGDKLKFVVHYDTDEYTICVVCGVVGLTSLRWRLCTHLTCAARVSVRACCRRS